VAFVVRFERFDAVRLLIVEIDADLAQIIVIEIERIAAKRSVERLVVHDSND
jgi:hypothetical protein